MLTRRSPDSAAAVSSIRSRLATASARVRAPPRSVAALPRESGATPAMVQLHRTRRRDRGNHLAAVCPMRPEKRDSPLGVTFPWRDAGVPLGERCVPLVGRTLQTSYRRRNVQGGQVSAFFAAVNVGDSVQKGL